MISFLAFTMTLLLSIVVLVGAVILTIGGANLALLLYIEYLDNKDLINQKKTLIKKIRKES